MEGVGRRVGKRVERRVERVEKGGVGKMGGVGRGLYGSIGGGGGFGGATWTWWVLGWFLGYERILKKTAWFVGKRQFFPTRFHSPFITP